MALTKFTEKLISDSFKASISGSDTTESSSFASRITLVEGGTTSKTLVSSSAQIATDISGSFNSTSSSLASRVTVNEGRVNQGVKTTDSPTFTGGTVTGDFTVGGTLTAQEVHTEFESASILFTSGSTIFGNSSDDVHNMTGSLNVSGAINLNDGNLNVTDTMTVSTRIGIGGSPSYRLDVQDTADPAQIRLKQSGNTNGLFLKNYNGNEAQIVNADNGPLVFKTNDNEVVRFKSGGNVGIGTNNPASLLTVAGDNKAIDLRSADYSNVLIGSAGSSGAGLDRGLIVIREDGSNNTLLYGDGVAYFGGAVTSSLLLVEGVSNYTGIEIKGSGASRPQLKFRNVNQGDLGQIYGTEGNDLTIIAADDLILDATGEHIHIDDGGTRIGNIDMGSQNLTFRASVQDKDIIFRGQDGSSEIEAMRIDFSADGAVGIGTASPAGKVDVWSGSSRLFQVQTDGVGVGNNNPGTYGVLHVTGVGDTSITGSTFYDGYGEINISGNPVGPHTLCLSSTAEASSDTGIQNMGPSMVFRGQPGTGLDGGATFAAIAGTFDASNSNYAAQGNLRFFTSSGYQFSPNYGTQLVERMRINSSGNVGIGQTSPLYKLDMYIASATHIARFLNAGDNYNMHGIIIAAGKSSPVSAGDCNYIFFQDGGGTSRGGIRNSSTADNPEFFNGSDLRMKKDVAETKVNGLETINAIPLKEWNWNSEKEQPKTKIGIVADDLEKVLPELVSRQISLEGWEHCVKDGEEPLKTIPTETQLTLTLMKAVQELSTENDDLKKRIEALESN